MIALKCASFGRTTGDIPIPVPPDGSCLSYITIPEGGAEITFGSLTSNDVIDGKLAHDVVLYFGDGGVLKAPSGSSMNGTYVWGLTTEDCPSHYYKEGEYVVGIYGVGIVLPSIFSGTKLYSRKIKLGSCMSAGSWTTAVTSGLAGSNYPLIEEIDAFEAPKSNVNAQGTSGDPNRTLVTFKMPDTVTYLSTSTLRYCNALRDVYFRTKSMSDVRGMKTTATGSTLWNFTNFPTGATIHCTDGDIRYTNGAWTDFAS